MKPEIISSLGILIAEKYAPSCGNLTLDRSSLVLESNKIRHTRNAWRMLDMLFLSIVLVILLTSHLFRSLASAWWFFVDPHCHFPTCHPQVSSTYHVLFFACPEFFRISKLYKNIDHIKLGKTKTSSQSLPLTHAFPPFLHRFSHKKAGRGTLHCSGGCGCALAQRRSASKTTWRCWGQD